MGFTDFSSDAGLDRESIRMGTKNVLIYLRIKYMADYEELYCWVSFSTPACFNFILSFFTYMMRNILVRVYEAD